jgi:hypothetical protein
MAKILFNKNGVLIRTIATFPITGPKEVENSLSYHDFVLIKDKFVVNMVRPIIENKVLVAIELDIDDPNQINIPFIEGSDKKISKKLPKDVAKIGTITSKRYQHHYDVYENTATYFIIKTIPPDRERPIQLLKTRFRLIYAYLQQNPGKHNFTGLEKKITSGKKESQVNSQDVWSTIHIMELKGWAKLDLGENHRIIIDTSTAPLKIN